MNAQRKTQRTIVAACPVCKAPIEVVVGRKSTARAAHCTTCDKSYDYSCWNVRTNEDGSVVVDHVEWVL